MSINQVASVVTDAGSYKVRLRVQSDGRLRLSLADGDGALSDVPAVVGRVKALELASRLWTFAKAGRVFPADPLPAAGFAAELPVAVIEERFNKAGLYFYRSGSPAGVVYRVGPFARKGEGLSLPCPDDGGVGYERVVRRAYRAAVALGWVLAEGEFE